jgi:hypothetical protein
MGCRHIWRNTGCLANPLETAWDKGLRGFLSRNRFCEKLRRFCRFLDPSSIGKMSGKANNGAGRDFLH